MSRASVLLCAPACVVTLGVALAPTPVARAAAAVPHVVDVSATASNGDFLQVSATDQDGAYGTAQWGRFPATQITLTCVSVQDVVSPNGLYHLVYASGNSPNPLGTTTFYYIAVSDIGGPLAGQMNVSTTGGSNPCGVGSGTMEQATGEFLIAP